MRHPLYPRGALCDCLPNGRLGRHHLAAAARGACFCSVRLHHRRRVRSVSTGSLLARCLRPCDHDPTFLHLGRHHEPLRRLRVLQRGGYLQQWRVQRPRGQPCPVPTETATAAEMCNEDANSCSVADPDGSVCADGLYCTGADTCYKGECQFHDGDPCPGPDGDGDCSESCNEAAKQAVSGEWTGRTVRTASSALGEDACQRRELHRPHRRSLCWPRRRWKLLRVVRRGGEQLYGGGRGRVGLYGWPLLQRRG